MDSRRKERNEVARKRGKREKGRQSGQQ